MRSIVILTRSLDIGGAQRQLLLLARELRERGYSVSIALFYRDGALLEEAEDAGIELIDLGKRGRWDILPFIVRAIRELRRRRPDLIYGFLGGGNLVASAVRPFIHPVRLIWSVRASNVDLDAYDWLHRLGYRIEAIFSRSVDVIISNSAAGASVAGRNGFPAERLLIVPNGVDTQRFRPDSGLRAAARRSFGLAEDDIAVGVLARLDPMKGHAIFLQAAGMAAAKAPNLRFLLIGDGPELDRLKNMAAVLGVAEQVIFAGEQDPVAALNALDVACSCSLWGEGFSNAIAEAMACGLPCVVTDVGDSALLVGPTGIVVPPGSPEALAKAFLGGAISLRSHDPALPRARIVENYSASAMVDRTLAAFEGRLLA